MQDFKQLKVWNRAILLTTKLYTFTARFPNEERYGLTSQIRRAAVSVASNIAEGSGRRTAQDFRHFLDMAKSSLNEIETQLLIVQELKLVETTYDNAREETRVLCAEIDDIRKMLYIFSNSLKTEN